MAQPSSRHPKHIAFIMDGNGRWATRQGLPRLAGHRAGAEALERVCKASIELNIPVVSVFAFAMNNWRRDAAEVAGLMQLFQKFMNTKRKYFQKNGVRAIFIGNRTDGKLSESLLASMKAFENATQGGTKLILVIAINYDGVDEIQRAAIKFARGEVGSVAEGLDTASLPLPDIVVRTGLESSGERLWRDSNFLQYQSGGATKLSVADLWPDVNHNLIVRSINAWRSEAHLEGGQRPESMAAE